MKKIFILLLVAFGVRGYSQTLTVRINNAVPGISAANIQGWINDSIANMKVGVVSYSGATNDLNMGANNIETSGNVVDNGGGTVSQRGVCWSTSVNPTISDSKTEDGAGGGIYYSYITGLIPFTTYHVRAYATNEIGTSYGADMIFRQSLAVYKGKICRDKNGNQMFIK